MHTHPPSRTAEKLDSGSKEHLYLFKVQLGDLYLMPEGISSCSGCGLGHALRPRFLTSQISPGETMGQHYFSGCDLAGFQIML